MGKVFRLHTSGDETLKNWAPSAPYGKAAIDGIQDPNGATSKKEITSIPSPFARMDLVKTAFKVVAESQKLEGTSSYHKLVSDALDVGEIFFNMDKLQDKVRILVWDKKTDLERLLQSPDERHRLLGETLQLFLTQDAEAFHFDLMQRIYLLDYIGPDKPNPINIIGATSPATLFFTSANELPYASQHIRFGNDRPFDNEFQPLYKRDFNYQRYWYCLRLAIPNFRTLFRDISRYLDLSFQHLSNEQKNIIQHLEAADYQNSFDDLYVNTAANLVEVVGTPLKKNRAVTDFRSDFQIHSSICREEKLPLVLPVSMYTKPMRYTTDLWDKNNSVPYYDDAPLDKRRLPGEGAQYPYLTISDFLENYIILDEDTFNQNAFFNGSSDSRRNSYLLPLRKEFFKYFTPEELMDTMPDGKKMFELDPNAGGIKAVLRIPIQRNEYITYERLYFAKSPADREANNGGIVVYDFNIALIPNIKFAESVDPRYRIALSGDGLKADLGFYQKHEPLEIRAKTERNIDDTSYASNTAYIVDSNFDYMILEVEQRYRGIVLPRWKKVLPGNKQFTFAVDFGTTNTHVEYSVDEAYPASFDITPEDRQINQLNDYTLSIRPFKHDYIPDFIGEKAEYKFPIRTALSEGNRTDWDKPVFSLADVNIPFIYEKEDISKYNKITTNLKWSNEPHMQDKVEKYLDSLFLLMRNKVLLDGGRLDATRIVWFYPASMTQGRYDAFAGIWENLYKRNFGKNIENVIPMSESTVPYYYYRRKKAATTDVISIDIGGGTTDVLVVNNGQERLLTSFRFAANAIFGDGYADYGADTNGFVLRFKDEIENILRKNDKTEELPRVLDKLYNKKDSAEIASFFFSLAENSYLKNNNLTLDFNDMLGKDGRGKFMFIFFYMAIIYHLARILKTKGMNMPRYITFSGTGSKVLNALTKSNSTLERFSKLIFEKVYNQPYDPDGLTILRELENPKEATCLGGLLQPKPQDYQEIGCLKQTLLGDTGETFITPDMRYEDIDDTVRQGIVEEVCRFCALFISLNDEFSYSEIFSADMSKWQAVEGTCKRDIKKYLQDGINKKRQEIDPKAKIEETFFFYPLVGILNKMAQEVYKRQA